MSDARRRARERAAGAAPGEPEEWLALARDAVRRGHEGRALALALEGLRHHPDTAPLAALLPELGFPGAWPCEGGDAARRRAAPCCGPRRGVQRWRVELPGRPLGEPVVDARGGAWVRVETAGLVRVGPEGALVAARPDWPVDLPPLLVAGEPRGLDPLLGELATGPGREVLRGADGSLYACDGTRVLCVDADGLPRWTGTATKPLRLAGLDERLVAVASEHALAWLERASGAWLPDVPLRRPASPALAVGDGRWLVSDAHELTCLRPPERRWSLALSEPGPLALGGAGLIVASLAGVSCLDLERGEPRWQAPGLSVTQPPLVDADGAVYLVQGGDLIGLDPRGARRLRVGLGALGPLGPPVSGGPGLLYLTAGRSLVAVA
ncbi:MAG: PQQ-binding-like beta-propeller repeat protein [Planctomycetota bacterium]